MSQIIRTEHRLRNAAQRILSKLALKATAISFAAIAFCSAAAPSADAQLFDLSAYKGQVVYLDFWASWCGPCKQSFPWLNELAARYGASGLAVVAVNVDHDRYLADTFLHEHRPHFSVVFDPGGAVASQYAVKAMPTSMIIGRDGQVRTAHSGFFENQETQYLADVRAALDEKAP